jgi:cytochrome P450
MIVRVAEDADTLPSGAAVRRREKVIVSPFVIQRDPALYPDPERYDPDRFTVEARRARPRFAYIPFGAGPRACIGRNLAMLEMVVTLARVLERFELEPVEDSRTSVRVRARRA